jgi:hypothetical protein
LRGKRLSEGWFTWKLRSALIGLKETTFVMHFNAKLTEELLKNKFLLLKNSFVINREMSMPLVITAKKIAIR